MKTTKTTKTIKPIMRNGNEMAEIKFLINANLKNCIESVASDYGFNLEQFCIFVLARKVSDHYIAIRKSEEKNSLAVKK